MTSPAVKPSRGFFTPVMIGVMALLAAVLVFASLLTLYVEYGKRVLVQRGLAEPGQLRLRSVSMDLEHVFEFKLDTLGSPSTEATLHLVPWLDGYVAFKPEYRERERTSPR